MITSLIASALMMAPVSTKDAWTPGKYMTQAVTKVVTLAKAAERRNSDLGFADGVSVLGGFCKANASIGFTISLEKGHQYVFIATGDEDATDVDFILKDSSGRTVDTDDDDADTAVVVYTPTKTGKYTFTTKLATDEDCFIATSVMSDADSAWNIPEDNLGTAIDNLIGYCEDINKKIDIKFFDKPNQWCLFGGVLKAGSDFGIDNISLSDGPYVIAGSCDDVSDDVDLKVTSGAGGRVVGKDDDDDNQPLVVLENAVSSASIHISNEGSKASLCLFCICD